MLPTVVVSPLARCWLSRSVSLLFNNQHLVALIKCHAFDVACNKSERGTVGPGWVKTDMTGGSGLITPAQARPGANYSLREFIEQFMLHAIVLLSLFRITDGRMHGPADRFGHHLGPSTDAELVLQASGFGVLVMGAQASRMARKLTVTSSVVDKMREG